MAATNESKFKGFSKETVVFFNGLKKNNTREWFEGQRPVYEAQVMEPAKAFVEAMGARLKELLPRLNAIPKINKSIFRLNRDTRFSMDPTPYKTNLGIYFWEGGRSRMEGTGFYFHLEPPHLMLGIGTYLFSDQQIIRYRRAVVDPKLGKELAKIVAAVSKLDGWEIGGKHYKRIPAGFDPAHPNAALLLHNGLYAGMETAIPKEFFSVRLIDYCMERHAPLVPLHKWLVKAAS
ncbi:MAG: DUF2461 domain-containing protein [Candidatus Aminicenantes bacterium]|nr:DUF2461 domain-containing protein [Candidatus Aminicenantes bacterium]